MKDARCPAAGDPRLHETRARAPSPAFSSVRWPGQASRRQGGAPARRRTPIASLRKDENRTHRNHPALDTPTGHRTTGRGDGKLDKVVFGVTAVLAVAFLAWGFLDTDSLSSASGTALGWTVETTGWLFVLLASGFVLFVIWLASVGPVLVPGRSK